MTALQPDWGRRGLTEAEAQARARRGEHNGSIAGGGRSVWEIIRDNVFTVFNIVLFVTLVALLALGLASPQTRHMVIADAVTSGGTVWLNMLIGLIQELYAKRKLDRLAVLHAGTARVYRDGRLRAVPFDHIVVGDEIQLQAGDRVPVDGPLIEARALEVNESLLTGESESVPRAPGEMLLSGSFCVAGCGVMRAERVGAASYANRLAATARRHKDNLTPLQHALKLIIELLVALMLLITALQLAAASFGGLSALQTMRQVTVIVTSFVPSGLILAVSVSLSVGALRISRLNTLVQRINAIESMGHLTVLCVDKTGTLTENRLAVRAALPLNGASAERVRQCLADYAFHASSQNNTAAALAQFAGPSSALRAVLAEVPFNSTRKWGAVSLASSAVHDAPTTVIVGAPEVVLPRDSADRQRIAQLAGEGLRVMALAVAPAPLQLNGTSTADASLVLDAVAPDRQGLALLTIEDRPRPDIADTIAAFQRLGVRIVIISGDHEATVRAVAARAGLPVQAVVNGPALAGMSQPEFDALVRRVDLFARVTPDIKRSIVASLRRRGDYVGMVGDGVNDVPALKEARLGIAMNDGAQIARDVSDLVLLDNALSTLPRALEEGQRITQRVYAACRIYMAKNAATVLAILFAALAGLPFPIEPRQMSWLTTLIVGIPCTALAFNFIRPMYTRSFVRGVLWRALVGGLIAALAATLPYLLSYAVMPDVRAARTVFIVSAMHISAHLVWDALGVSVFNPNSLRKRWRVFVFGLALLGVGVAGVPLLPAFLDAAPLTAWQWVMAVVFPLAGALALRNWTRSLFVRRLAALLLA